MRVINKVTPLAQDYIKILRKIFSARMPIMINLLSLIATVIFFGVYIRHLKRYFKSLQLFGINDKLRC